LNSFLEKLVYAHLDYRHVHFNLMELYGLPQNDLKFRLNKFNSHRRMRSLRKMVYQMNHLWFPQAYYIHGNSY